MSSDRTLLLPRVAVLVAALAIVTSACVASPTADPPATLPTTPTTTLPEAATTTSTVAAPVDAEPDSPHPADSNAVCPDLPAGEPLQSAAVSSAQVLQEGDANRPRVEAVVYPHPEYEGNPWSQWGQGVVLPDGRHLSALGDHFGEDGNSFVFEFDPATRELTRTVDVLSLVDHTRGDWGHGKIHAQMVQGACGLVWLTTYWGTRRNLTYSEGYRGDFLFAIDPERRTIHDLGVLAEEHGVPSLAGAAGEGLIYAEAVDPAREDAGSFVVYDTESARIVFRDDDDAHTGYRAIAVDATGKAYYSLGEGRLAVYDPATGGVSRFAGELPGDTLRAATTPDRDGIIYGVTKEPEVFFALDPAGSVRQLGAARGKTASVALSPDGSRLFHIPSTHGNAWKIDAPLVAVDTETGQQDVIVELESLAEEHLGLRLGGSYNVSVDASGQTVYIGMNAGALDDDEDAEFGEVLLMIVTLP